MRIDRDGRPERTSSASAVAQLSAAQPAVLTFAAALQRHRQREGSKSDESQRADSAGSRRAAAKQTPRPDTSRRSNANDPTTEREAENTTSTATTSVVTPTTAAAAGTAALGSLASMPSAAAQRARLLASATPIPTSTQDARWRRFATEAVSAPCIDISHEASGSRFRLSRENGVWLLSFQASPEASTAELQAHIDGLRAHFAAQGLGPLDVICID